MKFSLSNLLMLVALIAVAIGWWCDRARLQQAKVRLNAEAMELCSEWWMSRGSTLSIGNPLAPGDPPPNRVYDFSIPEDRAECRRKHRSALGPIWAN